MAEETRLDFMHESSDVDSGAQLGVGTNIWHFCHVMSGAVIGRDCSIGQNAFIGAGAVVTTVDVVSGRLMV